MDSQQLVSQAAPPLLRLSPPAEHDPSSSQQIHRSGDAGNGDTPVAHPVRSEQRRTQRHEYRREDKDPALFPADPPINALVAAD